ncbi:hypothetical protein OAP35_02270 [Planktomarina temperata]|nr:hypothetical protein [Planktomarina temperata]
MGANVVVGVDLDYVEMSSAGSVLILMASGATVVVEELVTNIITLRIKVGQKNSQTEKYQFLNKTLNQMLLI